MKAVENNLDRYRSTATAEDSLLSALQLSPESLSHLYKNAALILWFLGCLKIAATPRILTWQLLLQRDGRGNRQRRSALRSRNRFRFLQELMAAVRY